MEKKAKSVNNYVVTQSNRLIEADYSEANLPAKTLKIGRLIVSKISPDDKEFRLTKVKNSAIRQYLGYKKNVPYNRFNADLEDICKRLNEQPLRLETTKGTTLNAFFISSWEIDREEDTTIFEISGRLKEYLLELQRNYTSYQLENIPKLNSAYSIRFYELLCQYRKIGKRKFEVEDLKNKIGCRYGLYGHFKDKALLRAQKDLAKHTDIRFDFEELKAGRKVVSIIFYIYPNDPKRENPQGVLSFLDSSIELKNISVISEKMKTRLTLAGISQENIEKYEQMGFNICTDPTKRKAAMKRCKMLEAYYLEKMTLLEQSKTEGINPAGFIIKALKEDWQSPKTFHDHRRKASQAERLSNIKVVDQLNVEKKVLKKKLKLDEATIFEKLIANEVVFKDAYTYALSKMGKVAKQGAYAKIKDLPAMEQYQESAFISSGVHIYLKENFKNAFKSLIKLEQSIKAIDLKIGELG